jgi:hypothetical protein
MPADERLGLVRWQAGTPGRPEPTEDEPEVPVAAPQGRPGLAAPEHDQLLALSEVLGDQASPAEKQYKDQREDQHSPSRLLCS